MTLLKLIHKALADETTASYYAEVHGLCAADFTDTNVEWHHDLGGKGRAYVQVRLQDRGGRLR